ncbi:GEVED domain-containing protein [uncultured Dokdonia sp.]|uniref:GEVED domain-containing protein n=1 Tax=uncultured Dokdonia sp. TaxID=575653 RepID=UPI0030EC0B3A|tara:strand:+ start:91917 stop:94913 length:2997 start_codon:yes stop_codon:yes gene_type:complete
MKNKLLFLLLITFSTYLTAQELLPPSEITTGNFVGKTAALRDLPIINANKSQGVSEITIVPNNLRGNRKVNDQALPLGADPIAQFTTGQFMMLETEANFGGGNSSQSNFTPPDPSGAVGPDHYVQGINSVINIFDKQGTLLAGPTALGNFLGNGQNEGDPIVMYDQLADRFFVSQFQTSNVASLNNILVIGVSETPDPTGAYFLYQFQLDAFPDYPHYAVWPDAYYLTANKNQGNTTYALDRAAMLAGEENPTLVGFNLPGITRNPGTVFSPEPANLTGFSFPEDAPGYIVYLQDDGWGGAITEDHLKVWELDVNFDEPSSSTVSMPLEIPVAPFDSVFADFGEGDLAQPGSSRKIDMIGGVISYAANYRSFEDHNSWLITFNVDVDGNDRSGIRWTELRNSDTEPWSVFQQGTYAPEDGKSRFMGSGAMDAQGNIGLAFNIGSASDFIGISYTGRFDGDTAGEMTLGEAIIIQGSGIQTFTNRFGDYSHLTMDPNDFSFWHTAEYFSATNFWDTQIASFRLSDGFTSDVGVIAIDSPVDGILTSTETVQVTVRNFGTDPQVAIPISLSLDGVVIANEVIAGPIAPNSNSSYEFIATADLSIQGQSYVIAAETSLVTDQAPVNNDAVKTVTHLYENDLGVLSITAPESAGGLSQETVIIRIKNFGAIAQSDFEVQYSTNGGTPVVETFTGAIAPGAIEEFSFTGQADISAFTTYQLEARTNSVGDQDPTNDIATAEVINTCMPRATEPNGAGCQADGIKQFILNTINVDDGGDGCNTEPSNGPQGYADRTDLDTTLSNVAGQNEYVLQARHNYDAGAGIEVLSVWIDFNDNGIFEQSEQLIQGVPFPGANTLDSFDLVIPVDAPLGSHILRAKAIDGGEPGDINNPCSDFRFGEVQDYTVTIDDTLSVDDFLEGTTDLVITLVGENQFDVQLPTEYDGKVYVGVSNLLGQQLTYKAIARGNDGFRVLLNLANLSSGVYIVTVNDQTGRFTKTKKIIVQ